MAAVFSGRWRSACRGTVLWASVVCCVLSLTGCDAQASFYKVFGRDTDGEKFIKIWDEQGIREDLLLSDFQYGQSPMLYYPRFRDHGIVQTEQWISICNSVNKKAMRNLGFDPQKDLQNRGGGDAKWGCRWESSTRDFLWLYQTSDREKYVSRKNIEYLGDIRINGMPAQLYSKRLSHFSENPTSHACYVFYEWNGYAMMMDYYNFEGDNAVCDHAVAIAERHFSPQPHKADMNEALEKQSAHRSKKNFERRQREIEERRQQDPMRRP